MTLCHQHNIENENVVITKTGLKDCVINHPYYRPCLMSPCVAFCHEPF